MTESPCPSWIELYARRRGQLQHECNVELKTFDSTSFQESLVGLDADYPRKALSKSANVLIASLDFVQAFTDTLAFVTKTATFGSLIWAAQHAVVECACRTSSAIEFIFKLVATINRALPASRASLISGPYPLALEVRLHNLYDEFLEACVTIVIDIQGSNLRCLSPEVPPINKKLNFVGKFFSSDRSSGLKQSIDQICTRLISDSTALAEDIRVLESKSITTHHANVSGTETALRYGPQSNGDQNENKCTESRSFVTTITTFRNRAFVGRDEILRDMDEFFIIRRPQSEPNEPLCCMLHGLGGQGKSQVALEYAFRHTCDYDAVWWLNSETEQELARSYGEIAKKLPLLEVGTGNEKPTNLELELPRQIEDARNWLEGTNHRWLLIFDNLESSKNLVTYLPLNLRGRGDIIITTQKPYLSSVPGKKISLPPLSTTIGAQLLFTAMNKQPKDQVEESLGHEISEWVGGLPLALAIVGGFIKRSQSNVAQVLTSLQRSSKVWASRGEDTIGEYGKTLATVFDLALAELTENARHLLQILAFLNPDYVPEEMLQQKHTLPSLKFLNDEDEFLQMAYDLGSRQLIKQEISGFGPSLCIHRSLQLNILHGLKSNRDVHRRQRVFREVSTMIQKSLPKASRLQTSEPNIWPQYKKYVPQVISLRRSSLWPDPPLPLDLSFARLLVDVGSYLWHTGQYKDCEANMKTAEAFIMAQDATCRNLPETEDLLSDAFLITGILADCIGVSKRGDSLDHRLELLRLRKKAFEAIPTNDVTVEDKIRLGNAHTDLGCAYMQRGQYAKAGQIFEKILLSYNEWGPENEYPFEYSKYYQFSAFVLMAQGNPCEAIRYIKKGADLEELHAGRVDDTVLTAHYSVASLLFNAGELQSSLKLHEATLDARKALCGEGSQLTLESFEADYLQKCLTSRYRVNWTTEGIARAQFWLSRVLQDLGDSKSADVEARAARSVRDQFLKQYPDYLQEDPNDEGAVFDQMLPMWIMQTTGRLQEGGRNPANVQRSASLSSEVR